MIHGHVLCAVAAARSKSKLVAIAVVPAGGRGQHAPRFSSEFPVPRRSLSRRMRVARAVGRVEKYTDTVEALGRRGALYIFV